MTPMPAYFYQTKHFTFDQTQNFIKTDKKFKLKNGIWANAERILQN